MFMKIVVFQASHVNFQGYDQSCILVETVESPLLFRPCNDGKSSDKKKKRNRRCSGNIQREHKWVVKYYMLIDFR